MDLIVQPADGLEPVLKAIEAAKKSVDLTIFRLDRPEVVKALEAAVARPGVAVRALIAHTNGNSEKALRKLELRLLEAGVTVARSADDLPRYHGKLLVIDGTTLYLLGFNYTKLDLRSRSFGLVVEDDQVVKEALRLFEADALKQAYVPAASGSLIVSPENSRQRLSEFIEGAKSQLLIYDGKLSDTRLLKLIEARARGGVEVRVIGRCSKAARITCEKLPKLRLHIRCVIRDGEQAFLGSQSMRKLELDGRREVGIITGHRPSVRRMQAIFEEDWALTATGKAAKGEVKEAAASA